MAYYHIDRAQQYFRRLGLEPINAEPQNLSPTRFPTTTPSTRRARDEMQPGTGGVDDGEDADVIVHEYGHAVQDAQPDAFGGSSRARRWARASATTSRGLLDRDHRRQRVEPLHVRVGRDLLLARRASACGAPNHSPDSDPGEHECGRRGPLRRRGLVAAYLELREDSATTAGPLDHGPRRARVATSCSPQPTFAQACRGAADADEDALPAGSRTPGDRAPRWHRMTPAQLLSTCCSRGA